MFKIRGSVALAATFTLLVNTAAVAHPGEFWGPGGGGGPGMGAHPGPVFFPHHHPHPGLFVDVLPPGYQTVLIAGLTYFVLNDIWYRLQGDRYVVVDAPSTTTTVVTQTPTYEQPHGLTQVDIDGVRYYVRDGRYYRRNADGEYLEVTPPASQR